jgi:glycerol-1-phosphate dehydrogenase [NAD(P)+]
MDDLSIDGNPVTHGHKVAIGSLACAAFLETLFADPNGPPPASFHRPSLDDCVAQAKAAFAYSPACTGVVKTCTEKYADEKAATRVSEGIRDTWKDLRLKVLEQVRPYSELKALFVKARCPVLPAEVNLSRSALIACARRARMIRNRYNELDLAWDLGCFESVLAGMESSREYFY